MINFVKAMLAFQDYAAREALSANEVVLFMALFRVLNDRRWPGGMQAITNNQLLAHTTFYGSKRDDTLREARGRLAGRGLIRFTPGERRNTIPTYAINWALLGMAEEGGGDRQEAAPEPAPDNGPEAGPETAPEITPEIAPKNQSKNGGKRIYNYNTIPYPKTKTKTESEMERPRAPAREAPPNAEEVRTYAQEIGYNENPLKFIDYYAARGWPLRDWRAALRLWMIRDQEQRAGLGKRVTAQCYTQREYPPEYWAKIEEEADEQIYAAVRAMEV